MSMLSLLLCFTMLMGATFAWFTDTVTSSNNRIKAGNLKVDLVMDKPDESGVYDGVYDVISNGDSGDIFSDANGGQGFNWEPGKTEIVYLGVQNNGSLALKYNILLDVVDEGLIGSLEYAIIAGAKAESIVGVANDWEAVKKAAIATGDETATGDVPAGQIVVAQGGVLDEIAFDATKEAETDYFALAVHMKEEAGNVYQEKSVKIDVTVLATQKDAEEDSFDDKYDKDAPIAWSGKTNIDWYLADSAASEFELSTAEDLAGLAAIVNGTAEGVAQDSFRGRTIKLASDIDLGNLSWTTIGKNHDDEGADPFEGNFDGQGNVVYNLNIHIEDDKRDSVGFFGYAKNARIEGLTIKNVSINADYFVGAVVGKLTTGEIYDCHVKGDIDIVARRNYAAGIVGDGYYSMEKCSVVADGTGRIVSKAVAGGLCGRINEGSHSIKNCVVKNMDIQSGQQIAAITGFLHYGNTVTGCLAENTTLTLTATEPMKPAIGLVSGLWYYKEGAPITISGNTFRNITVEATANATGTANILYGWEWSDRLEGIQDSNNVLENISNNLVYSSIS